MSAHNRWHVSRASGGTRRLIYAGRSVSGRNRWHATTAGGGTRPPTYAVHRCCRQPADPEHADATDAAAVQSAVDTVISTYGKLDILVNNAGTAIPKPFEETTLKEIDQVIDLNVRGLFIATQAALKHLPEGGRIISTAPASAKRLVTSPARTSPTNA